jgi:perosamine synthetase
MTDLQAAVGLVQLDRLDEVIAVRRTRAARYGEALGGGTLTVPSDPAWGTTNHQSYWVELPTDLPLARDDVLQRLLERGISARRGIMAAHLEPACADLDAPPLPVTERITANSLILPLFHEMTDVEQDEVVDALLGVTTGAVAASPPR